MSVWQLLFGLQGRIRRLQWWLGHLGAFAGSFAIFFVCVLTLSFAFGIRASSGPLATVIALMALALWAVLAWTSVALAVKRLHDLDQSGWLCALLLVPIVNLLLLIAMGFVEGSKGRNAYGPSPKGRGGEDLQSVFS